jgi:hypothetical protein
MARSAIIGAVPMLALALCGCVSGGAYQPPATPETTEFSEDLNASFDQVWSAVTYVAGSTFFDIKNFDKGSGLMTLVYTDLKGGPGPYVRCGTMIGGIPPFSKITDEPNSVLNYIAGYMSLSGRANITVRSRGAKRTTVQVNSAYQLTVLRDIGDVRALVGRWDFTSREPDSHPVRIGLTEITVTCQPSYKIEHDFLTEVSARL